MIYQHFIYNTLFILIYCHNVYFCHNVYHHGWSVVVVTWWCCPHRMYIYSISHSRHSVCVVVCEFECVVCTLLSLLRQTWLCEAKPKHFLIFALTYIVYLNLEITKRKYAFCKETIKMKKTLKNIFGFRLHVSRRRGRPIICLQSGEGEIALLAKLGWGRNHKLKFIKIILIIQ